MKLKTKKAAFGAAFFVIFRLQAGRAPSVLDQMFLGNLDNLIVRRIHEESHHAEVFYLPFAVQGHGIGGTGKACQRIGMGDDQFAIIAIH